MTSCTMRRPWGFRVLHFRALHLGALGLESFGFRIFRTFRVWGFEFRVLGFGVRIFRVQILRLRVSEPGRQAARQSPH